LLLLITVFSPCFKQIVLELLDDVEVLVGDLGVVVLDLGVLLGVLHSQLFDSQILLLLDHSNLMLTLVLHLSSQVHHFVLVLLVDFVDNPLKVLAQLGLLLVLFLGEGIKVLLMPHFLLFLGNLQRSKVLLEFSLVNSIFIFDVL